MGDGVCVCWKRVCVGLSVTLLWNRSIKHPLVFVTLVLADVCENAFCLYSLYQTVRKNRVVPKNNDDDAGVNEKRSLVFGRKRSSVYNAMENMKHQSNADERQGTALFIVSILLQREMVETMVPFQALGVMSILYVCDQEALLSFLDS